MSLQLITLNWFTDNVMPILLTALSVLVTGLATWSVSALTKWLNTKIKDTKAAGYLTQITQIVTDAVMNVFQSFVQTLKDNGNFGEEAQAEAREKALAIIQSQLTDELKAYIQENFGDMQNWLLSKIEAIIYSLKTK